MLPQSELKELLDYNSDTGVFRWKVALGTKVKVGDVAGYVNNIGYSVIRIKGKPYLAHRLAWLYVYESFPINQIDHIDGNRINNQISNLRDVTHRENNQNRRSHRNGHLAGTSFCKREGKWRSVIYIKPKQKFLGYYLTAVEANQVYLAALADLQAQVSTEPCGRRF